MPKSPTEALKLLVAECDAIRAGRSSVVSERFTLALDRCREIAAAEQLAADVALTPTGRALLEDCANGADVWGYGDAKLARQLEKLGLLAIVPAMATPPGHQQQPYFGAIPTAAGVAALQAGRRTA